MAETNSLKKDFEYLDRKHNVLSSLKCTSRIVRFDLGPFPYLSLEIQVIQIFERQVYTYYSVRYFA